MSRHGSHSAPAAKPRYQRGGPAREQNRLRRWLSEWRLALRIARRSVWRSRGTSVIVALMVLLPVAGFSAAIVIVQSSLPTPSEKIAAELGQNEAKLLAWNGPDPQLAQDPLNPQRLIVMGDGGSGVPPDEAAVRALFPEGTSITVLQSGQLQVETEHGIGSIQVAAGPLWDDSFTGRTNIIMGEAPSSSDGALVSAAALERLGARVGDSIRVTDPTPRELSITGVLDDAQNTDDSEWIYVPHGSIAQQLDLFTTAYYLPNAVITAGDLPALNHAGVTVLSRNILSNATASDLAASAGVWAQYGVILGAVAIFAIFEIILLAGAAFAVGARKQQRALATLGSVGGEKRVLTRVVLSQGIVLGGIGGVAGLALGVPAAAVYMTVTDDGSATQYWGFHADPLALGGILLLAVIVGLLSAVAPARAAVRFDVLAALRGSRKPVLPSQTAPRWGLALLIVGVAASLVGALTARTLAWDDQSAAKVTAILAFILGPLVFQVGVMMCGGLVLRVLSRVVSRVGLGARMASRDSAANTRRAVPAFASVMATAFLAVTTITVGSGMATQNETWYTYQAMPGQARVFMPIDDDGPTASVDELVSLIEADLPHASSAAFYSPMTRWDDETMKATAGALIVPAIPPESLCPLDPRSPEYIEDAAIDSTMSISDSRCSNHAQQITSNRSRQISVTTPAGLETWYGSELPREALDAFSAGSAIVSTDLLLTDGDVTLQWWDPNVEWSAVGENGDEPESQATLDALVVSPAKPLSTNLLISVETAKTLGIELDPSYILASPGESDFSQAQIDALNLHLEAVQSSANVETGPAPTMLYVIIATLLIAGALFVCASAVAIGLSRADGRADDATLSAVGATRMLRRSFAFWQAIVLVGIGTVTGGVAGLLFSYALTLAGATGASTFDPPWLPLAALAVGMPLVIAIGSWLVASKPVTLVRRAAIA